MKKQKLEVDEKSLRQQIEPHVGNELDNTTILAKENILTHPKVGKVRDCYEMEDKLVLIASDRVSGFDRHLASIPFKGQVLTQVSLWWFEKTKHIIPNHVIATPDPNVIVGKKCTVFPIEFVVRGYITGSTATSMWTHYSKGVRNYCGHQLPEGLKKNQRLEKPLVTPTTKSEEHDELISAEEIVSKGFMSEKDWKYCHDKALELFTFGQKVAKEHGLLLVDTKYEFGKDSDGNILLIDEIHTPDSSRYWMASSFEERFHNNQPPENIDKDIIREWYKQNSNPYEDETLPEAPKHLVVLLSQRYIQLFQLITEETFEIPKSVQPVSERLIHNLKDFLK